MKEMIDGVQLMLGNSFDRLKELPDNSVDSIVTDPPYGISFMNKNWDLGIPFIGIWQECFRVLKPGGYLLSFAATRTHHKIATTIEDAGFEIRDMIAWTYASGFPKSHNISKNIGKAAGVERQVVGKQQHPTLKDTSSVDRQTRLPNHGNNKFADEWEITAPETEEAKQWDGWGTALKPAIEPITVARKPLSEKTIVENVLKHGTGGINIDACRVPTNNSLGGGMVSMGRPVASGSSAGWDRPWMHDEAVTEQKKIEAAEKVAIAESLGRWPANLIHDDSDEVRALFPDSKGQQGDLQDHSNNRESPNGIFGKMGAAKDHIARKDDDTSAARFFKSIEQLDVKPLVYCPKASRKDRNEGMTGEMGNNHPTVKPTDLMRYLCKLVTPPNGIVLDPFMGSGSTGKAAIIEGFRFIGIDLEQESFDIATLRMAHIVEKVKPVVEKSSLIEFFE